MVTITARYEGELRCTATHGPSGSLIETDAPTDNQGKGERFSPTDLLATALGTCMLTVMGIQARKLGLDMTGATVQVEKRMVAQPVRRIAALDVQITMPQACAPEQQQALEQAAHSCPVHHSLHPDTDVSVRFIWG